MNETEEKVDSIASASQMTEKTFVKQDLIHEIAREEIEDEKFLIQFNGNDEVRGKYTELANELKNEWEIYATNYGLKETRAQQTIQAKRLTLLDFFKKNNKNVLMPEEKAILDDFLNDNTNHSKIKKAFPLIRHASHILSQAGVTPTMGVKVRKGMSPSASAWFSKSANIKK